MLVTIALVALPPTAAVAIEAIAQRIDARAGRWAPLVLLALFVAIWAMQAFRRSSTLRRSIVVNAVLIGALFAYLYTRGGFLRMMLAVLSPAILVVLVWFLGLSTAASRAWRRRRPEGARDQGQQDASRTRDLRRVLGLSLLAGRGAGQLPRYPAFRRLACARATWYRSATTVADVTNFACKRSSPAGW